MLTDYDDDHIILARIYSCPCCVGVYNDYSWRARDDSIADLNLYICKLLNQLPVDNVQNVLRHIKADLVVSGSVEYLSFQTIHILKTLVASHSQWTSLDDMGTRMMQVFSH